MQVDWRALASSPFYGFNPSRAHGPQPRVAVALDATPTIHREHMFHPAPQLTADAPLLYAALGACTPAAANSPWVQATVSSVLQDFARVGRSADEDTFVDAPPRTASDAQAHVSPLESFSGNTDASAPLGGPPRKRSLQSTGTAPSMIPVGRHGFVAAGADCTEVGGSSVMETLAACEMQCMTMDGCTGVNYNRKTLVCDLRRCNNPLKPVLKLRGAGWIYTAKQTNADNVAVASDVGAQNTPPPSTVEVHAPSQPGGTSLALPPDGVFTFVSENGFAATGEDCPRVGRENGVSLEVCKASCVAQSTCNGINYHGGEKWCILRGCSNSQQPFLTNEGAPWNFFGLTRGAGAPAAPSQGTVAVASRSAATAPHRRAVAAEQVRTLPATTPISFIRALGYGEASGSDCVLVADSSGGDQPSCEAACVSSDHCNSYDYNSATNKCRLRTCTKPLAPWLSGGKDWAHYGVAGGQRAVQFTAAPTSATASYEGACGPRDAILRDIGLPPSPCPEATAVTNMRPWVALPTEEQLDDRCLDNCFVSSQRRRDISLAQGYQQYGCDNSNGRVEAFHKPFLLESSLPALAEWYGDMFVSLNVRSAERLPVGLGAVCLTATSPSQYYAHGPRVPELNLEDCESDKPGGTSGHVIEVSGCFGDKHAIG